MDKASAATVSALTPTERPRRILVKLSGEALLGQAEYGIDPAVIKRVASELRDVQALGVQVAVVLGGGNLFRGAGLARAGMDRVTADHMGMLATVMNALALQDALEGLGIFARVMSAIRRHRQSLLHHRHRRLAPCDRDRGAAAAQGHQGRWDLLGRSAHGPQGHLVSAPDL